MLQLRRSQRLLGSDDCLVDDSMRGTSGGDCHSPPLPTSLSNSRTLVEARSGALAQAEAEVLALLARDGALVPPEEAVASASEAGAISGSCGSDRVPRRGSRLLRAQRPSYTRPPRCRSAARAL